ncbi:hypothetical protein OSG_eHP5_00135 [environmental Halophage eHP-5]|nr:hypothetical protein OSG_eHP5_00135 [environmental Halophage eHP-5]
MTNWATIRIRKETKEQAEADKNESETWDEYLCRCNPETQTETETETDREFCDLEDLTIDADTLYGRIDDLETEIKVKIEQETRR